MANRTFGWVQNPSSTTTLRDVLALFVPDSEFHTFMVQERLPLLASAGLLKDPNMYMVFQKALRYRGPKAYNLLKGQGAGGVSRADAKCSGLVQAAVTGQQFKTYVVDGRELNIKKPYTDDWTADGFIRWAVSLGLLDYDYNTDCCNINKAGIALVKAETEEEQQAILGRAFLAYPPACRVMGLLDQYGQMTKFEIGSQLGFTDEPGFTSFPQNIWVQAYEEAVDASYRNQLRSNTEGSSDKYARMICRWLAAVGWVKRSAKTVEETIGAKKYVCEIESAYEITPTGRMNYRKAMGKVTGIARTPKIVYREMLASKAPDADYLRRRRSAILQCMANHVFISVNDIIHYLKGLGIDADFATVKDDLSGLINIGLDIESNFNSYRLRDKIQKLVPYQGAIAREMSPIADIRNRVRQQLQHINHKYLNLIDYAFSGKNNCMEFEVYTIDLLVNELTFNGTHLGGSRKPDGIVYDNCYGVIIDNKAYAKGFTITRSMADEMTRYVQENNDRNPQRNANQWWQGFDAKVSHFNFLFISSLFSGNVPAMLDSIEQSTGVSGSALTVENLLYFANAIKGGALSKAAFFNQLGAGCLLSYTSPSTPHEPSVSYSLELSSGRSSCG